MIECALAKPSQSGAVREGVFFALGAAPFSEPVA
jgi:hypothetical protein